MGDQQRSNLYKGMGKDLVLHLEDWLAKDKSDQSFFNVPLRFGNLGKRSYCPFVLSMFLLLVDSFALLLQVP